MTEYPVCPVCGEECETFYRADSGEIVGCEQCVDALDAWDVMQGDEERGVLWL